MRKLLLAGAATFGLIAAPAVLSAQGTEAERSAATATDVRLTTEQRAAYDAWPADRRAEYDALEPMYQNYYWTLNPQQQDTFWVLTPEQRAQIMEMPPQARASAWASIEAQMAASGGHADTNVAARTGGASATPQTASRAGTQPTPSQTIVTSGAGAVVQPIPGGATAAANREYPVCTATLRDSCQNPGEGGAPGRSRALPYWPGDRD